MELVGPGFEADIDDASFSLAGRHVEGRGLDLELSYRIGGWRPGGGYRASRLIVEGVGRAV